MRHLHTQFPPARRDERGRAAEDDLCPELEEPPEVRPGRPAVGNVADQTDSHSVQITEPLTDREDVEQSLGRMLVRPITRIDHAHIEVLGQQVRGAGGAVSYDDGIDPHGLEVPSRIDERLPLRQAAGRCREVNHVGTQPAGSQREARPRAGGVLEEQVHDRRACEHRELSPTVVSGLLEEGRRVEQQPDFITGQPLEVEQVAVVPAGGDSFRLERW